MMETFVLVVGECLFTVRLFLASLVFVLLAAPKRNKFVVRITLAAVLSIILAVAIFYLSFLVQKISFYPLSLFLTALRLFLPNVVVFFAIWLCFKLSFGKMMFVTVAGNVMQGIVYIFCQLLLEPFMQFDTYVARVAFEPFIPLINVCLMLVVSVIVYMPCYKFFAMRLKPDGAFQIRDNILSCIIYIIALLVITAVGDVIAYLHVWEQLPTRLALLSLELVFFVLFLFFQFGFVRLNALNAEVGMLRLILRDKGKQYQLSKENIDIINRKCHDLKHQMEALRFVDNNERQLAVDKIGQAVMLYDSVVKTESEVLNVLLTEKSLYCNARNIKLSCIIDSSAIEFMNKIDLYTMLGNALDNSIESADKITDKDKRTISLTIKKSGGFACFEINNYYAGDIKLDSSRLPITSKVDNRYHGFGLKSIRYIAEKYNGSFIVQTDGDIFIQQILVPFATVRTFIK